MIGKNSKYIDVLSKIIKNVSQDKYIVLGSAATLSYTSKIGYDRQINDLDIIADQESVNKMKQILFDQGFKQSTFINKRMPFYKKLIKHSEFSYLHFFKNEIYVEILVTQFVTKDSVLKFDLYPSFWVKIPQFSLANSRLGKVEFTTLDVNLLWSIKYLLHNTLGKIMHYKGEQRIEDLSHLRKLIDLDKAKKLISQCRFGYKFLSFEIPDFFLK